MNTNIIYKFTPEQLRLTNRKDAARAAGDSPGKISEKSRRGFKRDRLITGAEILLWLREHPDFCINDVYPVTNSPP